MIYVEGGEGKKKGTAISDWLKGSAKLFYKEF